MKGNSPGLIQILLGLGFGGIKEIDEIPNSEEPLSRLTSEQVPFRTQLLDVTVNF